MAKPRLEVWVDGRNPHLIELVVFGKEPRNRVRSARRDEEAIAVPDVLEETEEGSPEIYADIGVHVVLAFDRENYLAGAGFYIPSPADVRLRLVNHGDVALM